MAVVGVTTLTLKPDGYEDYLLLARKSKALVEKCGGKNIRLLAALVAGEATGTMVFTFEADDLASWGAVGDKFMADPEGVALMSTGSSGPIATQQLSGWIDVPL